MSFDLKPISTDKKLNDNFIILLWNRSNKIKNYSQNLKTQYTQMDPLETQKNVRYKLWKNSLANTFNSQNL